MRRKAFYLKINREENYAIKNLSRWIDAAFLLDADCYIVCDSSEVKKKIEYDVPLYSSPIFIESNKCSEIAYIVDKIANRNWKNVAYAHLTTFWDARERGYKEFWNIDADDTRMCVTIDKMAHILAVAEECAKREDIDCFSLDMWNSETEGKHWSFGVTYVNSEIDWFMLLRDKCEDREYREMDNEGNQNVDWFFTYLKNQKLCKNESFYIENMKFVHYSNDFVEKPIASGLFHWKDGKLIYPFMYYGFGMQELGSFDIAEGVYCLDVTVDDYEGTEILAYYAREGKDISRYYDVSHVVNKRICALKNEVFLNKHGYSNDNRPEIICFGAGNALDKNISKIKELCNLKLVCDNDESKWGKEIREGITCISPKQLKDYRNAIVVILVYSRNSVVQIEKQLQELGIDYDYMDNWFLGVE